MTGQQLKNSILQEAIEGRLVPQDPNDEPASVLLERIRAEKARLVKEKKIKKDKNESRIYRTEDGHWIEHFEDKNREDVCIDDEIPFEIPSGWEWVRHNELFDISGGSQPPKSDFILKCKEGYIRLYQIRDYGEKPSPVYIPISKASKITQKGDILLARYGGSLGKVFFAEDGAYNVAMAKVEYLFTKELINHKYLYFYYHSSLYQDLVRGNNRSAQGGFNKEDLNSLFFPLPPLAEQRRIVEKIESLLPKVDAYGKAQEELEKLNEVLPEQLKKSILQEAIEGRLVPQDPNDEPASELLERIRAEKARLVKEKKIKKDKNESRIYRTEDGHWMEHFEDKSREDVCIDDEIPFDVPSGWEWCRLGSVSSLIGGFAFKSHEYEQTGSRVIRISDISEEGFVNKNIVRYPFNEKLGQYIIKQYDILMAMTGGTVGKSLFVKELPEGMMLLNQRVALIRIYNLIYIKYIDYVVKSNFIQDIIQQSKNSTNDNISMADIYDFLIPLPPLAEQHRIVEKIESLLPKIEKLKVKK